MKQCTEIEMRNCENLSIITDEVKKKADQAWKKCMELQFITLPTESVLPRNQQGQWKMRTEKLVEMMKDNERLSKFARKDENGNINKIIDAIGFFHSPIESRRIFHSPIGSRRIC
jgi:hypothetical protein